MRHGLVLIAYAGLIFWQSSHRLPDTGMSLPGFDKVLHLAAYALMGWLACRAIAAAGLKRPLARLYLLAAVITIAYGLSDEWHQSFVPGRSADGWDLLADALGAVLGVVTYHYRPFLRRPAV